MTPREVLARLLAEYDENVLRPPSFVTMDLARAALARDPLVERIHDALADDPRGCHHPPYMRPQCERIAAALA